MIRVRAAAGATIAVLFCSAFGHSDDQVFEARMRAAERNEQSEAGRLFDPAFQKEFGAGFAPRVNECVKRTGGAHSDPFDVLIKLKASGTVEEALVRPKTPFSECFTELTRKATFPPPPAAGYWVIARMRFSQP